MNEEMPGTFRFAPAGTGGANTEGLGMRSVRCAVATISSASSTLTVIGFSVHDTIIVFDRIRENLQHRLKGETFSDLADRSIDQTISRSLKTSFTVVLTLLALFFFGSSVIHQFSAALLFDPTPTKSLVPSGLAIKLLVQW